MLTLPWSCLANLVSQTLCVAAATAAPFWSSRIAGNDGTNLEKEVLSRRSIRKPDA